MEAGWQDGLKTLSERVKKMMEGGLFTDHVIKVTCNDVTKEFKVNKIILAVSSSYFEGMFYGPLKTNSDITELSNIEPNLFEIFLRYIYTDKLTVKSFDEAKGLYVMSDMFLMTELKRLSLIEIKKHTTLLNVCQALEFHRFYNTPFVDDCVKDIKKHTTNILKSPTFVKIQEETLKWILQLEVMNLDSEIQLYNATVNWIKTYEKSKGPVDEETMKKLYSELMSYIRFEGMSAQEFSTGPAIHPYLSTEEKLSLLTKIACKTDSADRKKYYRKLPEVKEKKNVKSTKPAEPSDDDNPLRVYAQLPSNWRRLLYESVYSGDLDLLQQLDSVGADLHATFGKSKKTLFHIAVTEGQVEVVDWLIKSGLDVNVGTVHGWTPLHVAAHVGDLSIMETLLNHGAQTDKVNSSGFTPFDMGTDEAREFIERYVYI